jgi:hypothetical protein
MPGQIQSLREFEQDLKTQQAWLDKFDSELLQDCYGVGPIAYAPQV